MAGEDHKDTEGQRFGTMLEMLSDLSVSHVRLEGKVDLILSHLGVQLAAADD